MLAGRRSLVAVTAVASLVVPAVAAAPSSAQGRPPAHPAPANRRSLYFAGRTYPEAGKASVSTEFFVPGASCTSTNTGVALGAYTFTKSSSSEKPVLSAATVQVFCLGGEPSFLAAVELMGKQTYSSQRPHPGDLMKATIIDTTTTLGVAIQDVTEGRGFSLIKSTAAASATLAEIGDSALTGPPSLTPSSVYPITDFGTIHFSAGRVNGKLLGAAGGAAFDMGSAHKPMKIKAGPLTGGTSARTRDGFSTTWKTP